MKIKNQDQDRVYSIVKAIVKVHSFKICSCTHTVYNVLGVNVLGRKYLLGTLDYKHEAEQIKNEINNLIDKKQDFYSFPELVDYEIEQEIDSLIGGGL